MSSSDRPMACAVPKPVPGSWPGASLVGLVLRRYWRSRVLFTFVECRPMDADVGRWHGEPDQLHSRLGGRFRRAGGGGY